MASYGKILAPIVVPTGGWAFVCNAGTATIPAGTYATILHLLEELHDQCEASIAVAAITTSGTGITTITITGLTSVTWASCTAGLKTAIGFAGDEAVSSSSVTSTSRHTHGWYPGVVTYGSGDGAGISSDSGWRARDISDGVVSGAGVMSKIRPSRPQYVRRITYTAINRSEVEGDNRGPCSLEDRWNASALYWYPDRDDGDVADYGTQGDPGSTGYTKSDSSCDYWIVKIDGEVRIVEAGGNFPDYFTVSLSLNGEPA